MRNTLTHTPQSQFLEMFGNPNYNEKGLPTTSLSKIADNWDSKRIPITSGNRISGIYPYYGASGIVDYVHDYVFDDKLLLISEDGANLKDRVTPIAFTVEGKCWVNNHAHILKFEDEDSRIYVEYFINYLNVEKYLTGMAQPKLNQERMNAIPITDPCEDYKKQFASIVRQADKSKFDSFKSQFLEMFGNEKWEQKCLGEIGTFTRGGGFQKSDYVEHGIPCIHYGQIHTKFGPFIYSHFTEISEDLRPKTKFASKGDLIIAITSEDADGSCKSTAWLGDYPVAVGGHAAIFRHSMNPLYMSYFFKSTSFNHSKLEYVRESKVVEIRPDDIAKISVPVPPINLQEQFASIAEQADKSKYYELNLNSAAL